MWEAIAGLITIGVMVAGFYLKGRQSPKQRTQYEKDIEEFDRAIADGDSDTISRLFERLRRESGRDPARPGDQGSS